MKKKIEGILGIIVAGLGLLGFTIFESRSLEGIIKDIASNNNQTQQEYIADENELYAYRAESGDLKNMVQEYTKAIEREPENSDLYILRGNIYSHFGQYEKAIEDYSKAIDLSQNMEDIYVIYYNRGYAYDSKGEYDKAIEDFTKAIDINPEYIKAYNNRGFSYRSIRSWTVKSF